MICAGLIRFRPLGRARRAAGTLPGRGARDVVPETWVPETWCPRRGVMTAGRQNAGRRQTIRGAGPAPTAWRRGVLALAIGLLGVPGLGTPDVRAQLFNWPWSDQPKPAPVPREPVHRPPPVPAPPAAGAPSQGAPAVNWSQTRPSVCTQLEQRLSQETQRGNPREQLPRIENDIRQADKALRTAQQNLEKSDCYEYFLFSKTLRRTQACIGLNGQVEQSRRQMSDLEAQRQQILGSSGRSYQDEIIRELARNNCGPGYAQEARKREGGGGSSIWADEESAPGGSAGGFGSLPYATYRTVCVRLCDGYYFPISFSTTPTHFQRDADACQSKCAAPVEMYYYQNPGGAVDQMTAFKSQEPYTRLKTAFRYRKELVQGCSCKTAEFVPPAPPPGGIPADRRADAAAPAPAGADRKGR